MEGAGLGGRAGCWGREGEVGRGPSGREESWQKVGLERGEGEGGLGLGEKMAGRSAETRAGIGGFA